MRCTRSIALLAILMAYRAALAVEVQPAEMQRARQWVAAKFQGSTATQPAIADLTVLRNNDPVQQNARAGKPMHIAGKEYTRGLYCHAVSKVVVRLPAPARLFRAIAGVDSNDQTSGGRGSVVFSVTAGDRELFRSPLLREGMDGLPVEVPLEGARAITLDIGDGGDGITCDQADWADARVVLEDGKTIWLGDLPINTNARTITTDPPFSFIYDGRPSRELLAHWPVMRSTRPLDDRRTEYVSTWTDPATKLAVRCAAVAYADFPTVEWTLHFTNTGTADTPILESIQAIDTELAGSTPGDCTLHHHTGDKCTPDSYEPHADMLTARAERAFASVGGRPTHTGFPYFNLSWPGDGAIVVLSWAGQWSARFTRDDAGAVHVCGGQELTHFKLHPGETVRSPMAVVQFYQGDWLRAQNVWRQWMIAHNLPRPGGKLPPVQLAACSSHQFGEMIHADTASQILFVDRYFEESLKLDYWWMDAGWYWNKSGWPNTGTWEVDTKRFPGGLRPICDHIRAKGARSIVWFEPERVTPGTWLYDKHPEWLLGTDGNQKLLNLGNPEARTWLTDHVDRLITEQGIDLYRQDFNIDPLPYWRAADALDRQGITEIRHVEGYFAYWDALRARHPNMLIDSCASGGRRNDLETLRRAVPLLRSDYIIEPVGNQGHTYALSLWMPYTGTGSGAIDAYAFRSVMCPHFTACYDMRRRDLDYAEARRLIGQWRRIAPGFFGDYYPLTSYSLATDAWIGWQFDLPAEHRGFVQAFRRPDSIYRVADLRFRGLDPTASYVVTDLDTNRTTTRVGADLMKRGLSVEIEARPGSALLTYERAP